MAEDKNILEETTTTTITPTQNVSAMPTNDWAERRLQELYERDSALRAEQERERLRREQFGRDIGELARTFSDTIQAAGGAPVNPRDISKSYADLDNFRQRLFETEQARRYQQQQRELEQMRQERIRREERQARADELAAQRAHQQQMAEDARAFQEQQRARQAEEREEERKWQAAENAKNRWARYGNTKPNNKKDDYTFTDFDGNVIDLSKAEGQEKFNRIYEYLRRSGMITNDMLPEDYQKKGLTEQQVRQFVHGAREYITDPRQKLHIMQILHGDDYVPPVGSNTYNYTTEETDLVTPAAKQVAANGKKQIQGFGTRQ